jgi:uncharacterized membrane protein YeaQ/YmgE (transglycosylase-associated protein family)
LPQSKETPVFVIWFVIFGLVAGALARLIVPGKDSLGIVGTIALGMVGSFIGGFLGYLLHHDRSNGLVQTSGIIGSVVGAVIALLIYRKVSGGKRARV